MGDAARQAGEFDASAGLLARYLADCDAGWSMGTFGAIAEFTRDEDEAVAISCEADATSVVTPRGGLRLRPHPAQRLVASESLTRESWSQRIAICLPQDDAIMNRRNVLAEIGPDDMALRSEDRGGPLFDLGLDCLQVDVCVRMANLEAAQVLRQWIGQPVFAPGSAALPVLMAANPHRVFLTRLGRVEVFQPIPPPGGRSPDGPHTHILPKLLAAGRTHAATEPLPDGWLPCAHVYPAHPLRDQLGRPHAFRPHAHDAFQALLERHGDPDLVAVKRDVADRIRSGAAPSSHPAPGGRFARAALRIALRQLAAADDASPALSSWLGHDDTRDSDDAIDPMEQLH